MFETYTRESWNYARSQDDSIVKFLLDNMKGE